MSSNEVSAFHALRPLPPAARAFHAMLERLECGSLTFTSPEGTRSVYRAPREGPAADLKIADWDVVTQSIRSADIGFAEAWRDGRVETSDLAAFLHLCTANARPLEKLIYGNVVVSLYFQLKHLLRSNSVRQARKNIHAHYDLSNDFYALWLDETMTYSAALFDGDGTRSLADAQRAKYDRILTQLNVKPGDSILEIGCGWGGFAEQAAKTRGARVTGITLSVEQLKFAQARIKAAGLDGNVDLRLVDYRDVGGTFDHVVSIEMFEAVGEEYWPTYFKTVRNRLKPGGRAIIQAITIEDELFERYRASSDFIREYIFPGAMLTAPERFATAARKAGLSTEKRFFFGADYAETLKQWHRRLNAQVDAIRALGFDEKFLQLWRFYLCCSEAGFRSGRTNVMQVALQRPA